MLSQSELWHLSLDLRDWNDNLTTRLPENVPSLGLRCTLLEHGTELFIEILDLLLVQLVNELFALFQDRLLLFHAELTITAGILWLLAFRITTFSVVLTFLCLLFLD